MDLYSIRNQRIYHPKIEDRMRIDGRFVVYLGSSIELNQRPLPFLNLSQDRKDLIDLENLLHELNQE